MLVYPLSLMSFINSWERPKQKILSYLYSVSYFSTCSHVYDCFQGIRVALEMERASIITSGMRLENWKMDWSCSQHWSPAMSGLKFWSPDCWRTISCFFIYLISFCYKNSLQLQHVLSLGMDSLAHINFLVRVSCPVSDLWLQREAVISLHGEHIYSFKVWIVAWCCMPVHRATR